MKIPLYDARACVSSLIFIPLYIFVFLKDEFFSIIFLVVLFFNTYIPEPLVTIFKELPCLFIYTIDFFLVLK